MEITTAPHDPIETVIVPVILPDDIIHYNILTRLPAKSLLRFKSVSKDWYNLTKNPSFVDLHQNHALQTSDDSEGLVLCIDYVKNGRVCFYDSPPRVLNGANLAIQTFDILHSFEIVGSCNGFICLASDSLTTITTGGEGGVALCNPLTRECRMLSSPAPNVPCNSFELQYGFGYDTVSHDYKIAKITLLYQDEIHRVNQIGCSGKLHVYSTSTGLWSEIKGFPQGKSVCGSGVCLNNKLHWLVDSGKCSILTFDLHCEEFGEIRLGKMNPCSPGRLGRLLTLEVSAGFLYALWLDSATKYSIWVMKEYGVSESWMELYALTGEDVDLQNSWLYGYRSKKGGSGGEALMMKFVREALMMEFVNTYELSWYNFEDKSTRKVYLPDNKVSHFQGQPWLCTASIAPVPSL